MTDTTTRDTLIRTASLLFTAKGYAGVGLNEILKAASLPKGSLYHHFPGGKKELAREATLWAAGFVSRRIDASYAEAADFAAGTQALCLGLARQAEAQAATGGCPILSILQAGHDQPELRAVGRQVLEGWTALVCGHARRLGHPSPEETAEMLLIELQGAWVVTMATGNPRPFEQLAQRSTAR